MSVPIEQWAKDTGRELPIAKRALTLQVLTCYSCGEKHDGVALHAFNKPAEPWSHWYSCPTNGDPVPLSVGFKDELPVEYPRRVIGDLDRAMQHGKFLAVIFYVDAKGVVYCQWNAQDFPHAAFEACQKLFAEQCAKNGGLPAPLEPLPRANNSRTFDASKLFPGLAKSVPLLTGHDPAAKIDQAEPGNGQG